MTIADEIYDDPRLDELTRGELQELLTYCVDALELDEGGRLSNGGVADALFTALGHLPIDDMAAARIRRTIDEYFELRVEEEEYAKVFGGASAHDQS